MPDPRFLQIHFLAPYAAALLNRDDAGLAKRLPYGGSLRTRVSSQCLKRHWRLADDPHDMRSIDGFEKSSRSRDLVDDRIFGTLAKDGVDDEVLDALRPWFNFAIYGGGDTQDKKPAKRGVKVNTDDKTKRQTLLFGEPELRWLTEEARNLAEQACGDADRAFALGKEWVEGGGKGDAAAKKDFKANIKTLRDGASLPAGLIGALFGRMVTSDPSANIDAPVHVAHAFTVHAEEAESDYFIAADDLAGEGETGADTIQETELTSGLFYGFVVADLPGLLDNLGGDRALAGEVLHNLVYLIAEVSPGAKLGSTAPYSRASFLLLEAGDRQPRSLAEAFRTPCAPETGRAVATLCQHLDALDATYATGEERRVMSLGNDEVPGAKRGTLAELAEFARNLPGRLSARDAA